ncbi:GNAT family N-acetyltransferase, partial [Phocaeicola sartorii]
QEAVLSLTELLRAEGYHIVSEPRISGDGYFESVVLDPDGNRIECVYKKEQENTPVKNHVIETDRLILRPFTENDTEAVFNCCRNPNLGNNAGWKPHDTPEESLKILQTIFIPQKDTWAITRQEDQLLIGAIGILPDPKRENSNAGMIGYWLDEAQWGKGYMSEAVSAVLDYGFNKLGLTLISANCYPQNKRSQRVLEKMGFAYEGILHQAEASYDGKIYDHQCYYLEKNNLK